MPKLPVLSGKKLVKILDKASFEFLDQTESHVILIKIVGDRKLKPVVPLHDVVKPGTLLSVLKQSGLTRKEFEELMKK